MTMLPLSDCRVVSLALNLPGPLAASRLREFGAQITKIEPPAGDPFTTICPLWYEELTRGQSVVRLNLKSPEGKTAIGELLEKADILLTSFRPEACKRLSLDWSSLHERFPRLSQVAIVGFPHPRSNEAGHDLSYQAILGLLDPPKLPRTLLADLSGAEQAVTCALKLLLLREKTGGGSYEEVSLAQAAEMFAKPFGFGLTRDGGMLGGALPTYNLYRTRNGWIALAALETGFRERLQAELGLDHLEYGALQAIFMQKTNEAWDQWAREKDIPLSVLSAN